MRQTIILITAILCCTFVAAANEFLVGQPGLLIMAHGGSPEWNAAVEQAVHPLRSVYPVEIAFGMAQRDPLQRAVSELEAQGVAQVAAVGIFVSPESFRHQTEYLLGLRPDPPARFIKHTSDSAGAAESRHSVDFLPARLAPPPIRMKATIVLSQEGLYDSQEIGRIAVQRVQSLSLSPERESVLILAHGEGEDKLNDRWISKLNALATQVRQAAPFRAVAVETLREDWHEKRSQAEQRIRHFVREENQAGRRMIVVPFRVFGFGSYAQVLEDLEYVSDGVGLLPHPAVTEWIRQQAANCFKSMGRKNPFDTTKPPAQNSFPNR